MPKELRADLHERFADRLEAHPPAVPVVDELLGYHLERAVLLRRELGEADATTAELAARASTSLGAAGTRAAQRDDPSAASALLERAIALVALRRLRARRAAAGARGFAVRSGSHDRRHARARRGDRPGPRTAPEGTRAGRARARAPRGGDERRNRARATRHGRGPAACSSARATSTANAGSGCCARQAAWIAGRVGRADAAWRRAADCARRAGDERELFGIVSWRATAAVFGPTPVDEAIRLCEEFRELVRASPVWMASIINPLASLHAMKGEFELADRLLAQANETLHQLGSLGGEREPSRSARQAARGAARARRATAARGRRDARVDERQRAARDDERDARPGRLRAGPPGARPTSSAGRPPSRGAADDTVTQVIWRGVRAKVLAREGSCEQAEALAREAVALIEPTDLLSHHGDAMLDLAEVLRTCSRRGGLRPGRPDRPRAVRAEGQCGRRRASAVAPQQLDPGRGVDGDQPRTSTQPLIDGEDPAGDGLVGRRRGRSSCLAPRRRSSRTARCTRAPRTSPRSGRPIPSCDADGFDVRSRAGDRLRDVRRRDSTRGHVVRDVHLVPDRRADRDQVTPEGRRRPRGACPAWLRGPRTCRRRIAGASAGCSRACPRASSARLRSRRSSSRCGRRGARTTRTSPRATRTSASSSITTSRSTRARSCRQLNDPLALVNFRTPRFDLDSLYGSGPADQPFLYDWIRPAGVRCSSGKLLDVIRRPAAQRSRGARSSATPATTRT